ncbi:acylphosphatase [Rubripirellula sp.]|jgi:acylphosphatase|nr:acylphosphatase [Rubripirellula sp.]
MSQVIRQRWQYFGTVQGVGFRVTVQRLASGFPVHGFVRNNHDGSVTVEVQGETSTVNFFRSAITRELGFRVEESTSTTIPVLDLPENGLGFRIQF